MYLARTSAMANSAINENEPRFNLIDEAWLPVAGGERASLKQMFSDAQLKALAGTARQKIAVMKLLLAIAQAAVTPADNKEWAHLAASGMANACIEYLDKCRESFYLYGPRPFLQMPVQKAQKVDFGSIMPEIASGNNPRLMHMQCSQPLEDADRALLVLTEMAMSLGGKKGDKSVALAPGLVKKSAAPGPGMGFQGLLHSFLTGASIQETVWLNLLTKETIANMSLGDGIQTDVVARMGRPPWEKMPVSETCEIAQALTRNLMGRLIPLSRFCLLAPDGIHLTEGIKHPTHKEGKWDPSVAAKMQGKDYKVLWTNPQMRPWRSLSAMLAFLDTKSPRNDFECLQIKTGIERLNGTDVKDFGVWSGGMKVSSNAGEQYLSGNDDNVESEFQLNYDQINDGMWFDSLASEMQWLEKNAKTLFGCVSAYYKGFGAEPKDMAARACSIFWDLGEGYYQELLNACCSQEELPAVEGRYLHLLQQAYDLICPSQTARQIERWAECRPNLRWLHPPVAKNTDS